MNELVWSGLVWSNALQQPYGEYVCGVCVCVCLFFIIIISIEIGFRAVKYFISSLVPSQFHL